MDDALPLTDCPRCRILERQLRTLQARVTELERSGHRQANKFARRKPKDPLQKPGRKPGHEADRRDLPPQVDRIIAAPIADVCPDCGGPLEACPTQAQFQTDIPPVQPATTQFNIHVGQCRRCGKTVRGRHPEQTSNAVGAAANQIGPHALSLAAELKHRFGMAYRKIADLFAQRFGMSVCAGALARACQRLAKKARPTFDALVVRLRSELVVHADETGWRIGRLPAWLWVFCSERLTIYAVRQGRGSDVPLSILGSDFRNYLMTDGLKTYEALPYEDKLSCVAHILRRGRDLLETLDGRVARPVRTLLDLFHEAFSLRDRRTHLTERGFDRRTMELMHRLERWADRAASGVLEIDRLVRHVRSRGLAWLLFLADERLPATNNLAERQIRPAVIARKLGGCNRTDAGAATHAVLASLSATCRQQGKDFAALARRLLHQPEPKKIHLGWLPAG